MKKKQIEFLKELVETPSPTGFETDVADIVRDRLSSVADEIQTDTMGSVHAILKGTIELESELTQAAALQNQSQQSDFAQDYEYVSTFGSTYGTQSTYIDPTYAPVGLNVMLAAHMDEVGLMVTYISDDGYLSVSSIGGVDAAILPGMRVDVHAKDGVHRGVVARKPIHLIEPDERKNVTPLDKLAIDLGMSASEVKKVVRVGDPITYGVGFEKLGTGMAVSKSFDDKCGVFVACRVMEALAEEGRPESTFISAITVQEEIGTRGAITSAHSLNPDVAVAFDVTHATDYPGIDRSKYGNIVCGAGPVIARGPNINPYVFERLVAAAEAEGVDYQLEAEPGVTGTDARSIQVAQGGIPTGLISVPLRYMHTPAEVIDLKDIEGAIKIIKRFVQDLTPTATFIPGISEPVDHPYEGEVNKPKKSDKDKIDDLKHQIKELKGRIAQLETGPSVVASVEEDASPKDDAPSSSASANESAEDEVTEEVEVAEQASNGAPRSNFSSYTPSFSSINPDDVVHVNRSNNRPGASETAPLSGAQGQQAHEFKRASFSSVPLSEAIPGGQSQFGGTGAPRMDQMGYANSVPTQRPAGNNGTFNLPIIGTPLEDEEGSEG